jgi:hypothetical protein
MPVPRIRDEQHPRSFHNLTVGRTTATFDVGRFPVLQIGPPAEVLDALASFKRQRVVIFNMVVEAESGVDGEDAWQAITGKTVKSCEPQILHKTNGKDIHYCWVIAQSRLLRPNIFFA